MIDSIRPPNTYSAPHTRDIIATTPQVAIVWSSASRTGRPRNMKPIPKPMAAIASMLTETMRLSISQRSQLPAAFFRPVPPMVLAPGGQRTHARQEQSVRIGPYTMRAAAPEPPCRPRRLPGAGRHLRAPDIHCTRPVDTPASSRRRHPSGCLSLAAIRDALGAEEAADDRRVHGEPGVEELVLDLARRPARHRRAEAERMVHRV